MGEFSAECRGREPLAPGVIFQANLRIIIPPGDTRRSLSIGEKCRGSSANANGVIESSACSTFRVPGTSGPLKVGSKKYFCATRQLTSSSAVGLRAVKQMTLRDRIHDSFLWSAFVFIKANEMIN